MPCTLIHWLRVLKLIYQEHDESAPLMVETLLELGVPTEDARLLGAMPWEFPANRIAVERDHLGLPPVHPLIDFNFPPPPPAWLTPAVMSQMFTLALQALDEDPDGEEDEDSEDLPSQRLVLPA